MATELLVRFLVGGLLVSGFSVLGDVAKPKSFAGLFGAAPSVALATLGLTIAGNGRPYAALEARSMIAGALAFLLYTSCASWLMIRYNLPVLMATLTLIPLWMATALGLWYLVLK